MMRTSLGPVARHLAGDISEPSRDLKVRLGPEPRWRWSVHGFVAVELRLE